MHAIVQVQYSQRKMAANAQRKYTVPYQLGALDSVRTRSGFPMELKDVLLFSPSPSGTTLNPLAMCCMHMPAYQMSPKPYLTAKEEVHCTLLNLLGKPLFAIN